MQPGSEHRVCADMTYGGDLEHPPAPDPPQRPVLTLFAVSQSALFPVTSDLNQNVPSVPASDDEVLEEDGVFRLEAQIYAQAGPVVRDHQEVFVHGLAEPRSVKLRRDDGGHLP
ncbi:hypothetical protein EYF80_016193 [Liparis tanakae]|uniref:Uncharacterized protein n=1 Tax=Liparis tanakae TaxID=230148 RepID=A0A4Z2I6M8_9TELE|nr:hypothetical protein EYF80_016193 [Liparis tanakae]